jgi:hypothetical protein
LLARKLVADVRRHLLGPTRGGRKGGGVYCQRKSLSAFSSTQYFFPAVLHGGP